MTKQIEITQGWQLIGGSTQARIVPGGVIIRDEEPGLVFVPIPDEAPHYDGQSHAYVRGYAAQTWINEQVEWWWGKQGD